MHLTPNISYPLMIVVSALMLPVMIVRFYMGVWQMMFLDLPLIVASFWSISLFYVVAQRELYPKNWKRSIFMLPMLMAVGVGLTIINTRAVLEALFGVETSFVRTPKFAIGERPMKLENKQYRAPQRLAALPGNRRGNLLPGDGGVCDHHVQLPLDPVPGALCFRILLGRLHHALSGAPEPLALAEGAQSGTRAAGVGRFLSELRPFRDPAVPHVNRRIAVGSGLRIVGDHQDGLPQPPVQIAQNFQHGFRILGVQIPRRLVGQ